MTYRTGMAGTLEAAHATARYMLSSHLAPDDPHAAPPPLDATDALAVQVLEGELARADALDLLTAPPYGPLSRAETVHYGIVPYNVAGPLALEPYDDRRERANAAHAMTWLNHAVAPDLTRLAEYAETDAAVLSPTDIEGLLVDDLERAINAASGAPALSEVARALHSLPEPPGLAPGLVGLPQAALEAQRADIEHQWSQASLAASYRAEVRAIDPHFDRDLAALNRAAQEAPRHLDARIMARASHLLGAEVRPDLNPQLAALLRIDPQRPLGERQLAHLLAGNAADGSPIEGKARRRNGARVAFIDLTFTAPKSVSVAWAFAPTKAEADLILGAHRDAVDAASAYVASVIGRARKGDGGRHGSDYGHIAWASLTHYTARPTAAIATTAPDGREQTAFASVKVAGDPHLHTHRLVLNVTLTDQGRVGGLYLDKLGGRVLEFGAYYHAQLAHFLRLSGVPVMLDPRAGAARIPGLGDGVLWEFSNRARDANAAARKAAEAHGIAWDALPSSAKISFLREGAAKTRLPGDTGLPDFAAWQARAAAIGYRHRSVLQPSRAQPITDPAVRSERAYAVGAQALARAFEQRSVLSDEDARVAALHGLIDAGISGPRDIDRVTAAFRERGIEQHGIRTALTWAPDPEGRHRMAITTALHEAQEAEVIKLVRAAAADRSQALPLQAFHQAADRAGLDFTTAQGQAQLAAARTLATGGRFGLVIGVAGAGKTAMLTPLVSAWHAEGRQVYGVALAWRQTEALAGAGITHRHALEGFLTSADSHLSENRPLPIGEARGQRRLDTDETQHTTRLGGVPIDRHRAVVVIDEIGQVGTRQFLKLLRLQQQHGFSIVAVGDPKQCQAIEAGPVIDLIQKALPGAVPELLITGRQESARERHITGLFRDGRAEEAIALKRTDGTAQLVAGSYDDVVTHVAALWKARTEANRTDPDYRLTVFAPTNEDARAIGNAIREVRRARGEIGPDRRHIQAVDQHGAPYDLALAVGDRLRLFDRVNARYVGGGHGVFGSNGAVVSIVAIGEKVVRLRDQRQREAEVRWDSLRERDGTRLRLAPGDVLTIDAGQGLTSTEHINAMPAGSRAVTGFKGYVTESRHRRTSYMIIADGAERAQIRGQQPINDPRPITEADVLANVARNLSRQTPQESATAMTRRLHGIQRSALRTLRGGRALIEARQAAGLPGSVGLARRHAVMLAHGVARAAAAVERGAARVQAAAAAIAPSVAALAKRVVRRQPTIPLP